MTDNELNKWLFENITRERRHGAYPNYCRFLDAVRKVEEKVIERVGTFEYGEVLIDVIPLDVQPLSDLHIRDADFIVCVLTSSAMATARQRAEACKLVWRNE